MVEKQTEDNLPSKPAKICYNKKGKECDEEHCVAYKTDKENPSFYIKEYCGNFVDADTVYKSSEIGRTKFRKVGPSTFSAYVKYLQTNLQSYYHLAGRNIVE